MDKLISACLFLNLSFGVASLYAAPDPPTNLRAFQPSPPTGIKLSVLSSSRIDVSWDPLSTPTPIDGVLIEVAPSPTSNFTLAVHTIPWDGKILITLLEADKNYSFRLRSSAGMARSGYSAVFSAKTLAVTSVPTAPTLLSTNGVYSNLVNLRWEDTSGQGESDNESGFKIEQASSSGGPWNEVGTVGENIREFAVSTNILPSTVYWYRVKAYNSLGPSANTSAIQVTTPNASIVSSSSDSWLLVFTNQGTPVPQLVRDFFCNGGFTANLNAWAVREAGTYAQQKRFANVGCLSTQFQLSESLLHGNPITAEGATFEDPLKNTEVLAYLETQSTAIANARYVTVIHYLPEPIPSVPHMVTTKYDIVYLYPWYFAEGRHAPELNYNQWAETLTHEQQHKWGASDKYGGPTQACAIDPNTGLQYDGYDIMCHRVLISGGFTSPPFYQLKVTPATAREIGW